MLNEAKVDRLISIGELEGALTYIRGLDSKEMNRYLNTISREFEKLGEYNRSLEIAQEVLFQTIKQGDFTGLLGSYNNLLLSNLRKQEFNEAKEIINDAMKLVGETAQEETDNTYIQQLARLYNLVGLYHRNKGEFSLAQEAYSRSLEIRRKNNHLLGLGSSLVHLSIIYLYYGEFELSKDNNLEAMRLFQQAKNEYYIALCLHVMGLTYKMGGDIIYARNFFEKSLEIRLRFSNSVQISETTFELFLISIEVQDEKEQNYLNYLAELSHKSGSISIEQRYLLAKSIFLMYTNRIINISKAQKLLKQIISSEIRTYELSIYARIELIKTLVAEYRMLGNKDLFKQIESISYDLSEQLEQKNMNYHLIDVFILLSKYEAVRLNFPQALNYLEKSRNIKNSSQFEGLMEQIEDLEKELLEKQMQYKTLVKIKGETNIQEAISKSMNTLIHKRSIDLSIISKEMPEYIIILNEDGVTLFSYSFNNRIKIDKSLIGGFLVASDLGISNALDDKTGGFETIKFGKYTLIFQHAEFFICCYAFTGPVHLAKNKVQDIITRMLNAPDLMKLIRGKLIQPKNIKAKVDPIIKDIFDEIYIN